MNRDKDDDRFPYATRPWQCEKCRKQVSILWDFCTEDICPLALPHSGTNEREVGYAFTSQPACGHDDIPGEK